jgi:hypothetical protein
MQQIGPHWKFHRRVIAPALTISLAFMPIHGSAESLTNENGVVYENVTVVSVTPKDLLITYSSGGRRYAISIPLKSLPQEVQQRYGYDPGKEDTYKAEMARKDAANAEALNRLTQIQTNAQKRQRPAAAQDQEITPPSAARTNDWQVKKSDHFRVYYKDSEEFAGKADSYLEGILGGMLKRVDCIKGLDLMWSGDNGIRVRIYSSQQELTTTHKLPDWAVGCADYPTKEICIMDTEAALKSVAAHELGHQVFYDLMDKSQMPDWISEGVAQWLEPDDSRSAKRKSVVKMKRDNSLFSLSELITTKDKGLNGSKAQIFYCESLSVVGFLIDVDGFANFKHFCKQIQNGATVNAAILLFYGSKFHDINQLEDAWKASL